MFRLPLVVLLLVALAGLLSWSLLGGDDALVSREATATAMTSGQPRPAPSARPVEKADEATREAVGGQSPSNRGVPQDSDDRPRVHTLTALQRADMVKNCLVPRIQEVAAAHQGEKYRSLIEKVPGASPNYQELLNLASEIDALNLAYVLEKESAIVEAFTSGVGVVNPGTEIESTPGVHGQVMWGAPPGEVWGGKGAAVAVRFSLMFDAHPRLLEALKLLSSKQKEFDQLLVKSR